MAFKSSLSLGSKSKLSSSSSGHTTSNNDESSSDNTASKPLTPAERLRRYNETIGAASRETQTDEKLMMVKLFSIRSAHLPGNNWCQDWVQWMMNNHPLLGLCCRHRSNPVGSLPRLIILLTSACYGLIATNLVYLFYRRNEGANGNYGDFVTYENITLFTLGGILHSLADLCMWHLTACACCLPDVHGRKKACGFIGKLGPFVAVLVAVTMVAVATFALLSRLDYEDEMEDEGVKSSVILVSFVSELGLVWTYWHPLLSTFFFTGLIWPIFPCIGGRPKELARQADEAKLKAAGDPKRKEQIV